MIIAEEERNCFMSTFESALRVRIMFNYLGMKEKKKKNNDRASVMDNFFFFLSD